jgi:hypothetical protein
LLKRLPSVRELHFGCRRAFDLCTIPPYVEKMVIQPLDYAAGRGGRLSGVICSPRFLHKRSASVAATFAHSRTSTNLTFRLASQSPSPSIAECCLRGCSPTRIFKLRTWRGAWMGVAWMVCGWVRRGDGHGMGAACMACRWALDGRGKGNQSRRTKVMAGTGLIHCSELHVHGRISFRGNLRYGDVLEMPKKLQRKSGRSRSSRLLFQNPT